MADDKYEYCTVCLDFVVMTNTGVLKLRPGDVFCAANDTLFIAIVCPTV